MLNSIVSGCQSAFVLERQLIDGVLVANELVDFANKEGKGCLIFKVDFGKAYDEVSWSYLRLMLKKMGFREVWKSQCWLMVVLRRNFWLSGV